MVQASPSALTWLAARVGKSDSPLQLDADDPDRRRAYILERVRSKRRAPERTGCRCLTARIDQNCAGRISPYELAPAQDDMHSRPPVRVNRGSLARRNLGIKNSNAIILEKQSMVRRRCDKSI